MTATATADTGEELDRQEDGRTDDDELEDSAAAARKIAGYLIVAGCVIAVACIGFIVWEQWRANQAALASRDDPDSASLYAMANGAARAPAPDPGPQDRPGDNPSPEDEPAQGGE